MTDIRSLEQTLLDNLPWNKARIKFVARFLLALYAVRTVNLSILATSFSCPAKEESNSQRLQRFLRHFEMPYAVGRVRRQIAWHPRPFHAGAGSNQLESRSRRHQCPNAVDRLSRGSASQLSGWSYPKEVVS